MSNLLAGLLELCKKLEARIEVLEAENKALRIENAELKERLVLNSKNSSIPSSKELYKIRENKPKSDKKIEAQVGHEGNYRARAEADEVVKVELSGACKCGGEIAISKDPYIHQKVDIPEIKPHVVEYQLEHGRCRKCGKRKSSKLPKGVTADTFGPRVKSTIAALSGFYKNSKREVANIIKDIFNLNISVGSVSNSESRVAEKCQEAYEKVEQEVSKSEILHVEILDDPENIPLTNNHAEQQIRHVVVYRKVSYFTQSKRGNAFLERIISLYLTWKKKQLNPFQNLLAIVS